jgi:hypothetical protein
MKITSKLSFGRRHTYSFGVVIYKIHEENISIYKIEKLKIKKIEEINYKEFVKKETIAAIEKVLQIWSEVEILVDKIFAVDCNKPLNQRRFDPDFVKNQRVLLRANAILLRSLNKF